MTDIAQQHKSRLRDYFDGIGFERWSAIYGHAKVSHIRQTIRDGHAAMLELAEQWLLEALRTGQRPTTNDESASHADAGPSSSVVRRSSVLDAGCGTGLFSLALARHGFNVTAVDIAPQMVTATLEQARRADVSDRVTGSAGDLEHVGGKFDAVVCFDVLVHYPQASFAQLATHLASLTRGPLLLTYAPREPVLAALHWLGGRFPHGQRRTDIQMIPERFVCETLAQAGMQVYRQARISRGFYHVTLLEARRSAQIGPGAGLGGNTTNSET
jgi:magnesium-protoporphyrin O-methyltransferase